MSHDAPVSARRTDLDALRAGAMLLGIALHASLSFFPSFWIVADSRQSPAFGAFFSAIHGFRMPLFFVMCGFFSAMLLHRRGGVALVKHRFHRVFLPMLAGLFTFVPLTTGISLLAMSSRASSSKPEVEAPASEDLKLWTAAKQGDLETVGRLLESGAAVDSPDPEQGATPLLWAAAAGRTEVIRALLERGADVNAVTKDGGTALHAAAFLGYDETVDLLLQSGAQANAMNHRGDTPLALAKLDEATTRQFASSLKLDVVSDRLGERKAAIAESLIRQGGTAGSRSMVVELLMQIPLFQHLWFLWFLWWLVVGYAALIAIGSLLPAIRLPDWAILSPARYLWLIPLTMIPQWFMGQGETPVFGPDTSAGLLPIPHVFAYYAIFFGFGAIYYGAEDRSGQVGGRWWLPLAIGLGMVLPLGLALLVGWSGPEGFELAPTTLRLISVALQAAYPWLLTFGLMGVVRRYCSAESPAIRYLSDSAYWLYLAHLPLIVAAQWLVRDWPIPASAKFLLMIAVVTAFLLWTYQVMVRYTAIGRFLNGHRVRPGRAAEPAAVAAS